MEEVAVVVEEPKEGVAHVVLDELGFEEEQVVIDVLDVVEVGAGGPIWSFNDFSIAERGSILFTDSLNCDNGPPPLEKSGDPRSN